MSLSRAEDDSQDVRHQDQHATEPDGQKTASIKLSSNRATTHRDENDEDNDDDDLERRDSSLKYYFRVLLTFCTAFYIGKCSTIQAGSEWMLGHFHIYQHLQRLNLFNQNAYSKYVI